MARLGGLLNRLSNSDLVRGFKETHGQGKEDDRRAAALGKESKGEDYSNITLWEQMGATYPLGYRTRELADRLPGPIKGVAQAAVGKPDPAFVRSRDAIGLGLSKTSTPQLLGEIGGTLTNDFVSNRSRNYWWLLNAPQAVVDVVSDSALRKASPSLFGASALRKPDGSVYSFDLNDAKSKDYAYKQGWLNPDYDDEPRKGIQVRRMRPVKAGGGFSAGDEDDLIRKEILNRMGVTKDNDSYDPAVLNNLDEEQLNVLNSNLEKRRILVKRNEEPGMVNTLNLPAQVAINSAVGLLNPFGGQEGYKAVFESEEDPSVSSNPIGEVAAKYILGRTGNLLPYDEFKKVRPDVSPGEYGKYKAFKFDKNTDLNPFDDGQMTVPTGVLKYTNDGIHGPEVQFLGRSLPVATGILPTAAAIAGTALGARRGRISGGLLGGFTGLGVGMGGGNLIEQERRKRNQAENEAYLQSL